jgi:capsular polysaccharide biosynthesis protein
MEQQNRENNDEINLYDLWKVIAKRKKLIIGLFIVIVGLTAIVSFLMPDIYRGEAGLLVILKSEVITAKEITDLIGRIDDEKQLRMVPKSYSNVTHIKLNDIKDSKNIIAVTIDAKKIDDIPKALSEVVGYLNNMDVIKSTVSRDKEMLLKQSAELSDLIKSSPDLLATYHKLFSAGKLSTMGFNPIDVNKSISNIKVELLGVEQQISRLNNGGIEIAAQPYISSRPVSPKILRNVVASGILSLLLGVFLAIFIEYIGNIKNKKS